MTAVSFTTWPLAHLDALVGLVEESVPGEDLTPDELLSVWDAAEVIGSDDGAAAAILTRVAGGPGEPAGLAVQLLVVHPGERRRGRGRALLDHLEDVAAGRGCQELVIGGGLWPGVDVQAMTPLLALLDAAGYQRQQAVLGLALPATFRAPAPEGVEVTRALDDDDVAALSELDPRLEPRIAEHGTCFLARTRAEGNLLGFASHSVGRIGWLGPHATRPDSDGDVVGALAGELCRDLSIANRSELWIAAPDGVAPWVGLGAAVGRVFCPFSRRLA